MKGCVDATAALQRFKPFSVCMSLGHAAVSEDGYTCAGFAATERQTAFISTQFLPSCVFDCHQDGWDLASHSLHFCHWSDTTFKYYCIMNKQEYTTRQNGAPCLIQLIINQCTLQITSLTSAAFDISELYFPWNKHNFFILAMYSTMPVQTNAHFFFELIWTLSSKMPDGHIFPRSDSAYKSQNDFIISTRGGEYDILWCLSNFTGTN